jgi:DNA-binding TFAR19-related protein (PDSD5 family)
MDRPERRRPNALLRAVARVARFAGLAALAGAVGCASDAELSQDVREVGIDAFSQPIDGPVPEVVATPMADVQDPTVEVTSESTQAGDGSLVERKETRVTAVDPASQKEVTQLAAETETRSLRVGQRWPVESLVGQINGRPIFAEEIFRQIEAAVMLAAQDPNPDSARQQVDALVRRAFRQQVESELILAEAESRLTPEMKQGLLSWLRDLQETTIAERGGSRAGAEEALRDELQMSVEEFVEFRKNAELTRDILRRKVEPRVVVSWRDVERLYGTRRSAYAPDPVYRLARIRLSKDSQADKVELARKLLAEGRPFPEVADAVGMPEHGFWRNVTVSAGSMNLSDLTDDLQRVIAPLSPGQVSEPVEQRTSVSWYSVTGSDAPPSVSIFDRDLQLALRGELQATQERIEQARYIQSLQRRWLGTSIARMEVRLVQIARERYLDPMRKMQAPAGTR